jgi:DNA-binding GntR family transcriptional regulator
MSIRPAPISTVANSTYEQILERIVTCTIPPGTVLTEAGVATMLHTGRTPTREALARLVRERLVTAVPRYGYVVTEINPTELDELIEVRILLEPTAIAASARILGPKVLDLVSESRGAPKSDGANLASQKVHSHNSVHAALIAGCPNEYLHHVVADIHKHLYRVFNYALTLDGFNDHLFADHDSLLAAVVARDADAAKAISIAQIEKSHTALREALLAQPRATAQLSTGYSQFSVSTGTKGLQNR